MFEETCLHQRFLKGDGCLCGLIVGELETSGIKGSFVQLNRGLGWGLVRLVISGKGNVSATAFFFLAMLYLVSDATIRGDSLYNSR